MIYWPVLGSTFLWLALFGCNGNHDDPTPGDSDAGGDAAGDASTGDTVPAACTGTAGYIPIATAQTLDPIVEEPNRCLLYGIDRTGSEAYFVDTRYDELLLTVAVGSQPSDLTLSPDNEHLYVAVLGESKIVDLDAATGAIIKEVFTALPPYRIARGPDRLVYYVEEYIFSAIYEVDMRQETERQRTIIDFHEPDLAATADGTALFVGEANERGSELIRLDAADPDLPEVDRYRFDGGFGLPTPKRTLFLSEAADRIYYADRAFDAADLARLRGWLGSQVVAGSVDGQIVATNESLFDARTFVRFANRLHPGGGALFSADGAWLYEFDPTGSLMHRTPVVTLVGVHQLGQTRVPAGSLAQHDFTYIIADPNPQRHVIYGLDTQQNQLVYIDRDSLVPERAEIIGSSPTDFAIHPNGDLMVIATFGATQVVVIDLTNSEKAVKDTLFVPGNPYRIDVGSDGSIVYVEQDALADMTLVDIEGGDVGPTVTNAAYQPDIEFGPNAEFLYVGEAATEGARLYKVDMRTDPLDFASAQVSADAFSFPIQQVIYSSGFVYFAQHKFDAETLADLGSFDDDIDVVSPDGRFAFSDTRIYATADFSEVGGLQADSPLLAIDPESTTVFQFDNSTGVFFVQALP